MVIGDFGDPECLCSAALPERLVVCLAFGERAAETGVLFETISST